jgi:hypothetical protein
MKESIISSKKFKLFLYFLSEWKIICLFGFGFAILGYIYAANKKPVYISTLSFVVDSENMSSISGLAGLAGSIGMGKLTQGESIFEGDNLIELLTTKDIIESTLLKKIPHTKKTFIEEYLQINLLNEKYAEEENLKNIHFPYGEKRANFSFHKDSILKDVYIRLTEKDVFAKIKSNKVNIITITVSSKGPIFSRYFSEALMTETTKFYIQTTTKKARSSYRVLKSQVDSVRNELYNSMVALATSNDNMFGLNPTQNIQKIPSSKKQIDVQINSTILTELVKNMEISRVNLLNKTPIFQIIEQPKYPLEEKKIRKLYGFIFGGLVGGLLILGILFVKLNYVSQFNRKEFLKLLKESKKQRKGKGK